MVFLPTATFNKENIMGDELKVYTTVCDKRFQNIEDKLDSIDTKLEDRLFKLESTQNKMIGTLMFLSVFLPIGLAYISLK